jgi:hypothetical protein
MQVTPVVVVALTAPVGHVPVRAMVVLPIVVATQEVFVSRMRVVFPIVVATHEVFADLIIVPLSIVEDTQDVLPDRIMVVLPMSLAT